MLQNLLTVERPHPFPKCPQMRRKWQAFKANIQEHDREFASIEDAWPSRDPSQQDPCYRDCDTKHPWQMLIIFRHLRKYMLYLVALSP